MTVSDEMERRAALKPGMLVYYDTVRGDRVPCKIISRRRGRFGADDMLWLQVTGARMAYPRGFRFDARVGPFVQAREAIH